MICKNCNHKLPDDSEFCQYCGMKIIINTPTTKKSMNFSLSPEGEKPKYEYGGDPLCYMALEQEAKPHSNKTRIAEPSYTTTNKSNNNIAKKSANKKLILSIFIIPIIIAVILLLVIFLLIPGVKYGNAKKLLKEGNYELAYTSFLKLDGFSDSENMLLECRYVQAIKYRDAGDFDLANQIFESLGDYRDSKILIHNCNYVLNATVPATCTANGYSTYQCSVCEDTIYTESDAVSHSYRLVSSQNPTCQNEGYKTYKCSLCNDEYSEKLGKTSHNAVVTNTKEATCTSVGTKQLKCSICGYEYSEEIPQKSHNYSSATCTTPKTCSVCNQTSGNALGHTTSGVKCSRCGKITFETLYYSGTGSKVIDYTVPKGKFKITVTMTAGKSTVDVKVHYTGTYSDTYEWFYIIESGNSEVEYVDGLTSGTIVVNASSSYSGDSSWAITIEAINN